MSVANHHPSPSSRERRGRAAFWIDHRIVDQYGPILERYPFGPTALAVYVVLARRADRDGESWERVKPMARLAATSERTFQRCIRLLELLELVAVERCFLAGSSVQTSNQYTLLTPPEDPPMVDPDPSTWPAPVRPVVFVTRGVNRQRVSDGRRQASQENLARPLAGCQADTPPDVDLTPTPRKSDTPPGVRLTPLIEGNTPEGTTRKEESFDERVSKDDASLAVLPSCRLAVSAQPSFVIPEIGLTNRQVWAATLGELARRGNVGRTELESWLRPAALIGRDGQTLVIGAPNAVSRERIATRLLPALREALAATIGAPVEVSVVVAASG